MVDEGKPQNGRPRPNWLDLLVEEDRTFIKRFILASGSLKAIAQEYGVSYPTIRLRLDRLIQKIRLADDHTITTDFEMTLRAQHADGRFDAATLKSLLHAYRDDLEERT